MSNRLKLHCSVTDGGFPHTTSSPFAARLRVRMGLFFAFPPATRDLVVTFASSPSAPPTSLQVSLLALNTKARHYSYLGRLRISVFASLQPDFTVKSTRRTCHHHHHHHRLFSYSRSIEITIKQHRGQTGNIGLQIYTQKDISDTESERDKDRLRCMYLQTQLDANHQRDFAHHPTGVRSTTASLLKTGQNWNSTSQNRLELD